MTTEATTETEAADKTDETEKVSEDETTETTEDSETEKTDDEDDSNNVTPREKELRRLLRENEKELRRLRKTEEDARRAEMSETEKLREELKDRDDRLEVILRAKIAAEYGLDGELAERLRGATEEELEEDAKKLAELVKPPKPSSKDVGIGSLGEGETILDPVAAHRAATAGRRF